MINIPLHFTSSSSSAAFFFFTERLGKVIHLKACKIRGVEVVYCGGGGGESEKSRG